MPGNYLNIDTELPTFTGDESEKDMIESMMSYLTQLVDQLKYTLMNLDQSNFNQRALDEISTGSAGSIAEQVQTLAQQLNQTNTHVATLTSRMNTAEGDISDNANDIAALQGAVQIDPDTGDIVIGDGTVQVDVNGGTVNINGDAADIGTMQQLIADNADDIGTLQGAVQIDEDTGDITIGDGLVQVDVNGSTVSVNSTDIGDLANDVSDLTGAVQVDANGDITIGGTGIQVDINGDVYINGTPQ